MPKPNTGQGDKGKTHLAFGSKDSDKVSKEDSRIEAAGQLDELVSLIGVIKSLSRRKKLNILLEKIQDHLFRIEASVAVLPKQREHPALPKIGKDHITFLENTISEYEEGLPELKNFILPGVTKIAALLHLARAKTRTVERVFIAASREHNTLPHAQAYINRLSDVFFTLARWVNYKMKKQESKWIGREKEGV